MYFSTSHDLFFFVLAVAVGVLTVFLAWGMFYVIMILKKSYTAVREVERKLASVDALFNTVKDHLEHSSSSLRLLVEVAGQIMGFFKNRRENKTNGKKKTASL
jgi:uncharacterized membrane protein (DUF373 family)